jgi:hypothetical protein
MSYIINSYRFGIASPIPTDNLFLWLKPDAGVSFDANNRVTEWADQSGNDIHFRPSGTTAFPVWSANTFNGYGGIFFSGGSQHLSGGTKSTFNFLHGNPNSGSTVFVVSWVRPGQGNGSLGVIMADAHMTTDIGYWHVWEFFNPSNKEEAELWCGNGARRLRINSGNGTWPQGRLYRSEDYIAGWNVAGADRTWYLSGTSKGTAEAGGQNPSTSDAALPLHIGNSPLISNPWKGYIVEIIIYNKAISAGDRTTVNDYLKVKYNIS